jgi:endonuclease/exonuclease/phosphatase family metal-dependent hydrolase
VVGHVAQWRHQLELVRRAVAADRHSPSPVVVAGDFNATRDLPSFHAFLDDGWCDVADGHGMLSTWGAGGRLPPLLRLDHVLVSPDVGVRDVHRTRSVGSDHLGMLADLQFRT